LDVLRPPFAGFPATPKVIPFLILGQTEQSFQWRLNSCTPAKALALFDLALILREMAFLSIFDAYFLDK